MADPVAGTFKENIVHKIATAVITGTIRRHPTRARSVAFLGTYRDTGEAAPTVDQIKTEGVLMFQDDPEVEEISLTESSDIYILCNFENESDDDIGRLTVCV